MSLQAISALNITPVIIRPEYVAGLVAKATAEGREKERKVIGQELHDDINQVLAVARLYLEMARKSEKSRMDLVEQSEQFIMKAIQKIRGLSKSLVAPALDRSLGHTIDELLSSLAVVQPFNVHFNYDNTIDHLEDDLHLALYRIIQEQLNNIGKYAEAKNVWIDLTMDKCVSLTIRDDGKGFDPSQKKNGIGLNNIRTRAELFGGMFSVNSSEGNGCSLYVKIPLRNVVVASKKIGTPKKVKQAGSN